MKTTSFKHLFKEYTVNDMKNHTIMFTVFCNANESEMTNYLKTVWSTYQRMMKDELINYINVCQNHRAYSSLQELMKNEKNPRIKMVNS